MDLSSLNILAGAVGLLLGSAAAQETSVANEPAEEVIVTGTRDRDKQVDEFVRSLVPTVQDSIPRLMDSVCPAVAGFNAEMNKLVEDRLRQVATAARMPVGGEDCTPNVVLLIKPDKQEFLAQLAKRRPNYFNGVASREMRRVFRAPGPIAVWRNEGPVDADGVPLRWDNRLGYVNETSAAASRLTTSGRRATESAIMLIESGAIAGLTATQLADYAAMRLLARTDPARLPANPPPTILTLMDAPAHVAVPVTLTSWDLGLLRGLSTARPELTVGSQRAQIAREVNKELVRASQ